MFKPALKMLSVEPVGNYAIRINWSDGHNTGIYSFEHFRRDLPVRGVQAAVAQTVTDEQDKKAARIAGPRFICVDSRVSVLTAAGN